MDKIRVLYVEDELALGKITSDTLLRNGFDVLWAKDGHAGLAAFKNYVFHICVIDIMMQGLDGYSLVKEIRILNKEIPVLFLSARSLTDDVVRGFEIGGNDYLKKPFSIEELMVRINELVRRNTVNVPVIKELQIGAGTLNYSRMELRFDKKSQALTYRENELIKLLIENKNSVLNRKEVLIQLWGDDSFYNSRSLDVFISKIRKYLSFDESITIVNVRGVGFKLID